jgi:hypothetical protein
MVDMLAHRSFTRRAADVPPHHISPRAARLLRRIPSSLFPVPYSLQNKKPRLHVAVFVLN